MIRNLFIIFLVACLLLTACTKCGRQHTYRVDGIENFSTADSSMSLCRKLIPEGFIDEFDYIEADYHYRLTEKSMGYKSCETIIMYFEYSDEVYEKAKSYVWENMLLSNKVVASYKNYHFWDNYTNGTGGHDFPYRFSRVAYNDERKTLVFIAFDVSVELFSEAALAEEDYGAFLEKYYGEWYSFDE